LTRARRSRRFGRTARHHSAVERLDRRQHGRRHDERGGAGGAGERHVQPRVQRQQREGRGARLESLAETAIAMTIFDGDVVCENTMNTSAATTAALASGSARQDTTSTAHLTT
jgi:hypothetical protein